MCQLVGFTIIPDIVDVLHTEIDLTRRVIRKIGIYYSLVKPEFASVAGYAQHIVNRRIDRPCMNLRRPLGKFLHHRLLNLRRFRDHIVVNRLRNRKMKLIGGLNVRHFLEDIHEFRKIEELRKPGSRSVSGPFRRKLNCGRCFAECTCPRIEMIEVFLLQCVPLQVAHHREKFGH